MTSAPRWIDRDEDFAALLTELESEPRYALDTEFMRERSYYPQLALMQLAWSGGIALVDPLAVDVRPMKRILERDVLVIMHAGSQDLEILLRECGTVPKRYFDTQVAAAFLGFNQISLVRLLENLQGVQLAKGSQLADWTRRPLDDKERSYAAGDVEHLLALHTTMENQLREGGRLGWADEENERVRCVDREHQDPDTAWWRLKGSQKLRGRARHRAQALCAWRERVGQAKDRPTRFVLPDLALLSIIGRPPKSEKDLDRVRGLERRRVDARGLFGALSKAEKMSDDELHVAPIPPRQRSNPAAVSLALAWLNQLAKDNHLDPTVVATRNDVASFINEQPSRLDAGWRKTLAGQPLAALLAGERAVRLDGGRLVLEHWPKPVE